MNRLSKHYLPVLSLVVIAGVLFYFGGRTSDTITFIARVTGYTSLVILALSLLIGPANLILNKKNPLSTYFRRDIGIVGGGLAVIHSVTGLFVHLRGKTWLYFLKESDNGYSIRLDDFGLANYTGLLSAFIIIMLIVTSNDYCLKRINPGKWKNIQRLSYLMFILAIIHCYYYRVGKDNINIFYWLYIPLVAVVLVVQVIGIRLHRKKQL